MKPRRAPVSLPSGPTPTLPTVVELKCGLSVSIEDLFTALYNREYTGVVTLDFRLGRPLLYALGRPRRGKIIVPP